MPLVNLTEHEINIHQGIGVDTLPPSGQTLRVSQRLECVGKLEGINAYRAFYGPLQLVDNETKEVISELPPMVNGTTYIVSGQTLDAIRATGRQDFAAPGQLIRGNNGQPIGCQGLKVN